MENDLQMEKNVSVENITINDIEYKVSDLTPDCIAEIQSANFCDQELLNLNYKIAAITTAKNAYHARILELLPKDDTAH
tara:strand:- start:2807 stop:3043 length:237 start_codon:yes stop_codon:yes gene_type:complete